MDHLCKVLKKWENDWSMFEDKPKPAEKGDKAAANLAKGGAKKEDFNRIKKEDLPPVEKKIVERLKQEVNNDPIGNPSLNEALNYTHQMAATDKHGNKAKMACLPAA